MKVVVNIQYPNPRKGEDKFSAHVTVDKVEVNVVYGKTIKQVMKRVAESVTLYVAPEA